MVTFFVKHRMPRERTGEIKKRVTKEKVPQDYSIRANFYDEFLFKLRREPNTIYDSTSFFLGQFVYFSSTKASL